MRKILLIISLIFTTTLIFGQSAKKAEKLLLAGDFPAAIEMYEKLIEKDPDKAEYHMNLGECYIRTPEKQSLAIPALQKAVSLLQQKNKSEEYIDAKFLLGKAYHVNHKFDEAIDIYNELVINKAYKKYRSTVILQNEIRACEAAIEEFKIRKKVKIGSPGEGINTEFTQHSPFLIEDQGIFLYTSKEKTSFFNDKKTDDGEFDENIFFIYINNENDKEPDPYSKPINSADNEANCWASKDGTFMLIYKNGNIYSSRLTGNAWSKPEKFKAINSKYNETHASMNQERSIIYFSSNRPGGRGGKDIYFMKKSSDGKWSEAKPLSRKINTKFDEESPYIHEDGTLYFSSKGHNSIGGYDIFSAKGSSPTRFEKAHNLGMPVNSVEDDIFYFVTSDKKKGYFMSKRPEGKGRGDIYMVDYADSSLFYLLVKGNAVNEDDVQNKVKINSISNKKLVYNSNTDYNGNFNTRIIRGDNYFTALEAAGHFFEAFTFSAPYDNNSEKNLGSFKLDKIERGKVHKVYSLDYEGDDAKLNNENYLFLNILSDFMNNNNDLVINISSSGNSDDNLFKERKQNIIDYLKGEGMTEDMIFVDLLSYTELNEDIVITVLDKTGADYAFNDVVDNTDVTELDDGNIRGVYTIQLGAFKRRISKDHRFFKDFRGKVKLRSGRDNLNHYTFGKYKFKSDAEKYLVRVHADGFTDAFIREISWYDD
ncbi:MAG: tetratricopeptide repeat protein [Bacteroidales bacterium]|nr:tetratricopeptide repeat protein [Bacteroidales bacterium]